MAVALGQKRNTADGRFRPRPAGLAGGPALVVAPARQAPGMPSPTRLDDEPASKPENPWSYSEVPKVCVRAQNYFREKNVAFVEKDIEASEEARQEFDRLGGKGVPLILVGKQRMSGFSPGRMEQMLAAR